MAKRDYYEILGIARGATPEQIKAAYRQQAIKVHPDKNLGDKQAEEKFKELNEAYSVLSATEKRKAYDQFGHSAVDGSMGGGPGAGRGGTGGFGDLGDIFGDIFDVLVASQLRSRGSSATPASPACSDLRSRQTSVTPEPGASSGAGRSCAPARSSRSKRTC